MKMNIKLKGTINQWILRLNERIERTGAQYFAFGVFGVINYPLSYIMWHNVISIYNPLGFRLFAALLCIPLLFHRRWPAQYQFYLPLYWCFTILYCIPFFETYILLMNCSTPWVINVVLALFLFILLVDWLMLIVLLVIGVSVALMLYLLTGENGNPMQHETLYLAGYMYSVAFAIGIIFSRNKEKFSYEKIQAARNVSFSIAHELRTPLSAIKAGVNGIDKYINLLENADEKSLKKFIDKSKSLKEYLQYIETEVNLSNAVINMLLVNFSKPNALHDQFKPCSIAQCINEAIARYPFSIFMQDKVHWRNGNDFIFHGLELPIIHVLFNLFKNAIYYIKKSGKGSITLYLKTDGKYNELHFVDSGDGIDAKVLPYIFNQFYSRTTHGYGIGLYYCKKMMCEINGDICCYSIKGEFTEFVLKFPKIIE